MLLLLLPGPSVSPSTAATRVLRLNCRSSVDRLCRSTAGTTTDPFQLSGSGKGIDFVAKQRIVPAAAASLAVFVHQRGVASATEHIDEQVVVVGVIVFLDGFTVLVLFLLVGALKVVRVEDAAVQPLVVRVVQLTIAAAATGGAAIASAAAAVVVATLGRGAGDWSLAVAGHPSPAALGGGVQACTSRFSPRFRRWRVRGCRPRTSSCTRSSRRSATIALSIGCRSRRRVLMIDVIVLVVAVVLLLLVMVVVVVIIAITVVCGIRFRFAVHGRRGQGGRGHADTPTGANLFVRAGLGRRGVCVGGCRRRCRSSSGSFGFGSARGVACRGSCRLG